ncbi:MAG: ABC transporter ATP-binding protein [Parcubacteria group bacterium]|nr:ABC transporter ATP-binding protein [Parcubacteria group bacterium]
MNVIETKNLTKVYHDGKTETVALKDASFSIKKGEFVAIMGPSGSGKSTLLHVLGLLDIPSSGSYIFDGRDIGSFSQDELADIRNEKIGFVFQAFNLLPRTTVLENVKLPLVYSKVPESEWDSIARKAVESVGLGARMGHEPSELSGGEKQRVAIARALVNNPQIIFADEPTGNLDSKSGKNVMQIIQKLNEEQGKTVILITHETSTAEHAERVIHLMDGAIDSDKRVENRLTPDDEYLK